MKKYLLFISSAISILFFLLNSCTKVDTTTIGSGILPPTGINTKDTLLEVITSTKNLNDTLTGAFKSDNHLLGVISSDPLFGKTNAEIYFQVTAPTIGYRYPVGKDSITVDSLVLGIAYQSGFGDTISPVNVEVYKINETFAGFRADSVYLLNKRFNTLGTPIGTKTFTLQELPQKIYLRNDSVTNQLRIKLDNSFAQELKNIDTSFFKNDSTFSNFLRGLAIIPKANGTSNALGYFNLLGANTYMRLYYKYTNRTGGRDTSFTDFRFNQFNANANYVKRDWTSGEINGHPFGVPDNLVYIQATPGTYAKVKMPQLNGLGNVIVHNATLFMEQIFAGPSTTESIYPAPFYLTAEVIDDNTDTLSTYDSLIFNGFRQNIYGSSYTAFVGGNIIPSFDASNNSIGRYELNITRYVQSILTNKIPNNPIRISAPYRFFPFGSNGFSVNPLAYGRVRLAGGSYSNPAVRMRLKVVYSKF